MKLIGIILNCFLVFSFLVVFSGTVSGQERMGNESLALEYFNQGDFEKALPLFAQLIRNNPDDAMYNYYYGVSLVKNNIFETAAKETLLNAIVDKTPVNANFYIGNYFHALENWQEALDFYERYDGMGNRQERKALQLDYYVDLCKKKVNPFEVKTASNQRAIFTDTIKKITVQPDEMNFLIPEELKKVWFNLQINDVLVYHTMDDFRSEAGKVLFTKAWVLTGQNDSIVSVTDSLRNEHEKTVRVSTRLELVQQIVEKEQTSYQLLRDREKLLEQARAKESSWWEKAGTAAVNEFKIELQKKEEARNAMLQQVVKTEEAKVLTVVNEVPPQAEYINAPTVPAQVVKVSDSAEKIVYKVQIGSFKNGVQTQTFKNLYTKLSKLRKIDQYTDEKKYEIFTVGSFNNYRDVQVLKDQLILEGAKGAFILAFKDGVKIPVKDALKLTGEE